MDELFYELGNSSSIYMDGTSPYYVRERGKPGIKLTLTLRTEDAQKLKGLWDTQWAKFEQSITNPPEHTRLDIEHSLAYHRAQVEKFRRLLEEEDDDSNNSQESGS